MSLGQIKDYTPHFNFIIPRFDIATWHDYMESNFRSIDALCFNMFGIKQYKGEWQNSTTYQVGDILFIGDPESQYTGRLVKVLVAHTTTANDSFDVYYAHNPINYDLFMDAAAAEQAAKLARDWAIKTDGKVQGLDYSSKYYANLITPISSEIVNVSNISNEIVNVSNISADIARVDMISSEIVVVSGKLFEIVTNSDNIEQIVINGNNINDIITNATNINAINTNANNISVIQNAYSNAQSALNSKNKAQEWAISENIVDNIDYSSKYWAEKAKEWAESVGNPANIDLSNLTSLGQNIANWSTNVTNCITEIPQDIKLELNNGTVTLKAGSKVYVPNGAGIFDEVTISSDFSVTSTTNVQEFILLSPSRTSITHFNKNLCSSGTTQPTVTTTYWMWYDTTNNKIKYTTDNGVSWIEGFSLPLGLSTSTSSGITSIDLVFNGFGYFGSTIFALPGVKGLIPNGRNEDGSLKNIEWITTSVLKTQISPNCIIGMRGNAIGSTGAYKYDEQKNQNLNNNLFWNVTTIGESLADGTIVLNKNVFHAIDYNDFSDLKNIVDTNVVHKTGNETITGTKTFTGDGWITKIQNTDVTYNIAPSSDKGTSIIFADKNGTQMGCVESMRYPSNNTLVRFNVYSPNGNWASQPLELMVDANDNVSAFAPTPNVSSNGTNIATTAYVKNVLSALYPVGSIYIGTQSTCPLATLISGSTWVLVAQDKALWGGDGTNANTTIAAGLPNITGKTTKGGLTANAEGSGAISVTSQTVYKIAGGNFNCLDINFDASRSSSIYGQSSTVQPPAYRVNVWRRTA